MFNRSKTGRRLVTRRAGIRSASVIISASAFAGLGLQTVVFGQSYWAQPVSGSWENPANWIPAGVPYYTTAVFNTGNASSYTASLTANDIIDALNIQNCSVDINIAYGLGLEATYNLNVNASAGQTCSLTMDGNSDFSSPAHGFRQDDGPSITQTNVGQIGGAGATFLTLNQLGFACGGSGFNFGTGSTSVFNGSRLGGILTFTGNATYNSSQGSGFLAVVGASKSATLNVDNGSSIDGINSGIYIGASQLTNPVIGTGIVNVDASLVTGEVTVAVGAFGGTGSLNIRNGGSVIGQDFGIGGDSLVFEDKTVSPGSLTLSGSGSTATATTFMGVGPQGIVQISSGAQATTPVFNMATGSILQIALDAPDAIAVSGQALFAGTLDVTLGTAADPTLGNSYDLFTFGSRTGSFSTINLPALDPGLAWNTQNLYTTGTISVVAAVPEPAMGLMAVGTIALLTRRRRGTLH